MSGRTGTVTLVVLPAILVLKAGQWSLEQWAQSAEWWKSIPFGLLALLILSFWLGILVNDLLNSDSPLREWWREHRKVFDVLSVVASHYDEPHELRIEIHCLTQFRRSVRNETLAVRVRVPLSFRPDDVRLVHQEQITIAKDGQKRIRLGTMSITKPGAPHANHSLWGEVIGTPDLLPGQHSMFASRNIVEIQVASQIYRVYIHILDKQRREQEHMYILREDELPAFSN